MSGNTRPSRVVRARIRLHRALGRRAGERARWGIALRHYAALRDLLPQEPGPRYRVAVALLQLDRAEDAIQELAGVLLRDPEHVAGRVLLGRTLLENQRFAEAAEVLDGCADAAADPVGVLAMRARAARNLGDPETAERLFRAARDRVASAPSSLRDFERWIRFERILGADESRRQALRAAIQHLPDLHDEVAAWTDELRGLGGIDDALAALVQPVLGDALRNELGAFARVDEALGRGDPERAATLLLEMGPDRRTNPRWSSLMLAANPNHFRDRVTNIPPPRPLTPDRDIGFVCCHFNPVGYQRRLHSTRRFRAWIAASGVRLVSVELAFGDRPFELEPGRDMIQLRSPDVMWQKERLLNVGIERLLDEGYAKIGWLDADIVFEAPDWRERIALSLEERTVCQAFDLVHCRQREDDAGCYQVGSVRLLGENRPLRRSSGFAWAARREVLERVRLYDASILGGGDMFIQLASFDPHTRPDFARHVNFVRRRTPALLWKHYQPWAENWLAACGDATGYVKQPIQTFFHGSLETREYFDRQWVLVEHGFDPDVDLALDASGTWRWNSAKPELHETVARYFERRREDDQP